MDETKPLPPSDPPKKRAKKIKGMLGPYQTTATHFDAGERMVIIESITPAGITYKLKGRPEKYTIGHGAAFQRAVSITHNIDLSPREGRIKRGGY